MAHWGLLHQKKKNPCLSLDLFEVNFGKHFLSIVFRKSDLFHICKICLAV